MGITGATFAPELMAGGGTVELVLVVDPAVTVCSSGNATVDVGFGAV